MPVQVPTFGPPVDVPDTEVVEQAERRWRFPVVEIFGPTIQGEGPEAGLRVSFIRFGGCDYRCTWCDTKEAVLPEHVRQAPRLTAEEIVDRVSTQTGNVGTILLSGGNPGLLELGEVVSRLHDRDYRVSIETQGSTWKDWMRGLQQIVVSPKPPSAGYGGSKTWGEIDRFIEEWHVIDVQERPPLAFKVPCFDERDVSFAGEVAASYPRVPMFLSVVTKSGGLDGTFVNPPDGVESFYPDKDTADDVLSRYEHIIELSHANPHLRDARIIPQLHYLIWGAEKGR